MHYVVWLYKKTGVSCQFFGLKLPCHYPPDLLANTNKTSKFTLNNRGPLNPSSIGIGREGGVGLSKELESAHHER